jgi:dUTP pyrophosphatase
MITINIKNISSNELPAYATEGAAGLDVRAMLAEPVTLKPMERTAIPTGLYLEIPDGYEAQVRPRSGMALRHGITCLNTPGTIDSDYRGELKVILINLSNELQTINTGDRIAQMVFQKVEKVQWQQVTELSLSSRGDGGFGHTGKQ